MAKITILGGAGAVGSVAVKTLAMAGVFTEIVVADANLTQAEKLTQEIDKPGVRPVLVDAGEPESITRVINGSKVVLNTVGPFYKYAPIILGAVAKARINYVDVCDDYDATQALLAMDADVKAAGVTALVGMGSSPGVANVIARLCADTLLDSVESVDIYHAHGGEAAEGRAVVAHRIHSMVLDIPVFLDGRMRHVKFFEDSGRALEEVTHFDGLGDLPVYPYPHPETVTLPRFIKGIRRVTNLGTVLPVSYAQLIKDVVWLGLTADEPIDVQGAAVAPMQFAISYILSQRDRLTREAGIREASGCLKLVVRGRKDDEAVTFEFSLSSKGQGMGEGTGIPAALGVLLMAGGLVQGSGVLPPEGCVNPRDFMALVQQALAIRGGEVPFKVKRIGADGRVETPDLFAIAASM